MKRSLRIHYVDFQKKCQPNDGAFLEILKMRYDVILDEKNPDFLFFCTFSYNHYEYDCVKIFCTGENITPDFNTTDYAIAFDCIDFGDRYFRLPFFRWARPTTMYRTENPLQRKFCNFLYSNSAFADPYRTEIFKALSSYKQVDSGGSILNNIGKGVVDKISWQHEYKFSIACENSSKNGYTTEKILDALHANTVPIYWGNPLIEKDFSKECFINAMDFSSLNELVEYVKYLDQNDEEYLKLLNASWLPKDVSLNLEKMAKENNFETYPPISEDEDFKQFLFNIFDQEPQKARRLPLYGVAPRWHKKMKTLFLRHTRLKNTLRIFARPSRELTRPFRRKFVSLFENFMPFLNKKKN